MSLTAGVQQIVAGIISLLNNNRISAGKPPLGFLNIWLYGNARRGLMDITGGSNPGCKTDGFDAIEGWDPVGALFVPSSISTTADFEAPCRSPVWGRLTLSSCSS